MSMPFSSQEQLKKAEKFINSSSSTSCTGCQRGIRMCYTIPCMGTIDDIERLIDAGYAKSLMLDWWTGAGSRQKSLDSISGGTSKTKISTDHNNPFEDDIAYLLPAVVGLESKKAPFSRGGKCTMLVDNLCSLHDKELKPIQGKLACCNVVRVFTDSDGDQQLIDDRFPILIGWNTQRGKDLINRWKQEVNFTEPDEGSSVPTTFGGMLDCLFDLMKYKSGHQYKVDGCPQIDENEERADPQVIEYDKPF